MSDYLLKKTFQEINHGDSFFESLKQDYREFEEWFKRKEDEDAYVLYSDESIAGFMYLKLENEETLDVDPPIPAGRKIKIGTLKIDAHGTLLGERFIKKALDHAIAESATSLYITIFERHESLVNLLDEFGFSQWGTKVTANGKELVLLKKLDNLTGDLRRDYPLIRTGNNQKFLLSIYPKWHTKLFPDSILKSESYHAIQDTSHTNSISKTYVCFMDLSQLQTGDILIIYRTSDSLGPAFYRSVVTSVCTVEDIKRKSEFTSPEEYIRYTEPFSVFNKKELGSWWNKGTRLYVIKMLYNAAFSRRLIRKDLIERFGLDPGGYWGFMELTDDQFFGIAHHGGIDERIIIN